MIRERKNQRKTARIVGDVLHGTSTTKLKEILEGSQELSGRTYKGKWKSLGGTYLTTDINKAEHYARKAANEHGGKPVVLEVEPRGELTPNEDWVNSLQYYHHDDYDDFEDELYSRSGDEPIEVTYRKNFEELNDTYDITWEDSLRSDQTFRQVQPLSPEQIIDAWIEDTGETINLTELKEENMKQSSSIAKKYLQRKQSSNERLFLEGWCHHFATALHEKFEYPIRVFYTEPREDSWQYQLIPFHVVGDKSPTEMYDVRGQVSTSDVEDLLEADMEMIDHELYSDPARFYQEWTGTGEPLLLYDEQAIEEAKEIIEENPEKYGQEVEDKKSSLVKKYAARQVEFETEPAWGIKLDAKVDGKVVGHIDLAPQSYEQLSPKCQDIYDDLPLDDPKIYAVERSYLVDDIRGEGLGTEMYVEVVRRASDDGAVVVMGGCSEDMPVGTNDQARRVWEGRSFQEKVNLKGEKIAWV